MTKTTLTRNETTFTRLPVQLQRKIAGGCQCTFCKAHPHQEPKWDTLATDNKDVWTVHYPELETA